MKFQRIQDLRTDADLSQKQISDILHISQRSYSHYETGSRNIPIEMLIRLANYYETSIWLAVLIIKKCRNCKCTEQVQNEGDAIPPHFVYHK